MDVAQVAFTWKEGSGFHGSNQTTPFLHFPLFRCLLRIWSDIVWLEGAAELQARCVSCERLRVCASSAGSGGWGHRGGDAAQNLRRRRDFHMTRPDFVSNL